MCDDTIFDTVWYEPFCVPKIGRLCGVNNPCSSSLMSKLKTIQVNNHNMSILQLHVSLVSCCLIGYKVCFNYSTDFHLSTKCINYKLPLRNKFPGSLIYLL